MSHDAFVKAIRADPDDDTTRLVFADWYEENGQPERAEYVRAACRLARPSLADPAYPAVQRRCLELYAEHHEQWLGAWPAELEWSFDRGLVTGVTGPPQEVAAYWEELFAHHPIHRVRLSDSFAMSESRAKKELAWFPLVDDLRVYWSEAAHLLFGAFDPSALRFRRLWLDGDPDPEQVKRLLAGPTRERIESFRYINCRYAFSDSRDRSHIQRVGFHELLDRLAGSPLRELGVLLGGQSFGPDDLRRVLEHDFAPRLEYLELSAAEPTKACAELLASTTRLPALRRLDHGIDRGNRLHGLAAILNSPHRANLTELATEWSEASDRAIAASSFIGRATELQLWRPISARAPRSGVPLESTPALPPALDVALGSEDDGVPAAWANAPWAGGLRELRLRGSAGDVLGFATRLAGTRGFPALRKLTLVLDGTTAPENLPGFVSAVRANVWLSGVLVTCHANALSDSTQTVSGIVPAAAPENPGDMAWYACPPAVGRYRAFHVLPG